MYVSLCDFICLGLLLPFVLGFSLFVFLLLLVVCFFTFYECVCVSLCAFVCLYLLLPFGLGFYLFLFLVFFPFFLSLLLSWLAGRLLVLQPGVRLEPPRWESQVQDFGPPAETSQPHIISISKSSPRDLRFNTKTQLHPMARSSSTGCPMPNN